MDVDISVILAVGQRMKTFQNFLANYSVDASRLMKMEELEGVLTIHYEHLLTNLDVEKIVKMKGFLGLGLVRKAHSQLLMSNAKE